MRQVGEDKILWISSDLLGLGLTHTTNDKEVHAS